MRVPRQLGYKSIKYITNLTATDNIKAFGKGLGSASPKAATPGTPASDARAQPAQPRLPPEARPVEQLRSHLLRLPHEREQIGVDLVRVRGEHPVRIARYTFSVAFFTIFADIKPDAPIGTI